MTSRAWRRVLFLVHVVASLGWLGALAAFIVLDVTTALGAEPGVLRACYVAMDLLTRLAIVPLALAAFASGVAISLATPWGLFRHWWVVVTLALTLLAVVVLLVQLPTIAHRAEHALDPGRTDADVATLGNLLPHSIGGAVVLLLITWLNVAKPRGLTRHGWRKQQGRRGSPPP